MITETKATNLENVLGSILGEDVGLRMMMVEDEDDNNGEDNNNNNNNIFYYFQRYVSNNQTNCKLPGNKD
jgi:hypothetical protein